MQESKNKVRKTEAPFCASIFRNGERTTSKEKYTEAWVTVINALERKREAVPFPPMREGGQR